VPRLASGLPYVCEAHDKNLFNFTSPKKNLRSQIKQHDYQIFDGIQLYSGTINDIQRTGRAKLCDNTWEERKILRNVSNRDINSASGMQAYLNELLEFIVEISRGGIPKDYFRRYIPFLGTVFTFIFLSNWLGTLIPWKIFELPQGELAAPTADINTTAALALSTSVTYFYAGFREKGGRAFLRYISPSIVFAPINILEDFSKPLSLSFRLFGNTIADEIVVTVLGLLVWCLLPLPVLVLGLFASAVQALVFSVLSATYIGELLE
jgi:F-type H+-transporting ATPase subunit a